MSMLIIAVLLTLRGRCLLMVHLLAFMQPWGPRLAIEHGVEMRAAGGPCVTVNLNLSPETSNASKNA